MIRVEWADPRPYQQAYYAERIAKYPERRARRAAASKEYRTQQTLKENAA